MLKVVHGRTCQLINPDSIMPLPFNQSTEEKELWCIHSFSYADVLAQLSTMSMSMIMSISVIIYLFSIATVVIEI